MPFYEFKCSGCGHQFDVQYSVADRDNITWCPLCEELAIRRISQVSPPLGCDTPRFFPKE